MISSAKRPVLRVESALVRDYQIREIQDNIFESVQDAVDILGSIDKIDSQKFTQFIYSLLQTLPFCPSDVQNHVEVFLTVTTTTFSIEFLSKSTEGAKFLDILNPLDE